jgi:TetR/AcrR family transcriptional repressor of mexJK operon
VTKKRSGGRPSRVQSGQIEDEILDVASALFLAEGYGSVSIERIATECGISKRTFYHRFDNKEQLFAAVVHRLIARMRPQNVDHLFEGKTLEVILSKLADVILDASLKPEGLALQRLLYADAARFPELAEVMAKEGMRAEAVSRIAQLLDHFTRAGQINPGDTHFAAEQFLQMLTGIPQRRGLKLGLPMIAAEIAAWKTDTVQFFLKACGWKA